MVSLNPVVEFEPYTFSTQTRDIPMDADDTPEGWEQYWRDSLSDSGITGLNPLRQCGWWVPIEQLLDPQLIRKLLEKTPTWKPEYDPLTDLPKVLGGYALTNGDDWIGPGCCSDFSTLESWEEAAQWRSTDWQMVWIGHPWTHVSALNDRLAFLHPTEEDPPKTNELAMYVMRHELIAAINTAKSQVEAFTARVAEAMHNA